MSAIDGGAAPHTEKVTAAEVAAVAHGRAFNWTIRQCTTCQEPIQCVFTAGGYVGLDTTCHCVGYAGPLQLRSQQDVADLFNMQTPETRALMWRGFVEAATEAEPPLQHVKVVTAVEARRFEAGLEVELTRLLADNVVERAAHGDEGAPTGILTGFDTAFIIDDPYAGEPPIDPARMAAAVARVVITSQLDAADLEYGQALPRFAYGKKSGQLLQAHEYRSATTHRIEWKPLPEIEDL